MSSRVLKNAENQITMGYQAHVNRGMSGGIDLVKNKYQLAYVTAHSDGIVVAVMNTVKANKELDSFGNGTGNYVIIRHDESVATRYCHLKYGSIPVKVGDKVAKGQVIGYMGNTGLANGAHLHFEVREYKFDAKSLTHAQLLDTRNFKFVDPSKYIAADLPLNSTPKAPTKSNEEVAMEVYLGKWGNGNARISKLKDAGYNPDEIQAIVNQIVSNKGKLPTTTISENKVSNSVAVGDTVKLKSPAKYYDGKTPAKYVYTWELKVKSISGDRAVLTHLGIVIGAAHVSDIVRV